MKIMITAILCGLMCMSSGCKKGKFQPTEKQPTPYVEQKSSILPQQQEQKEEPSKIEGTYTGNWVTTNRKLDGTMKCVVTDLGNRRWKGVFDGVWQGQYFKYTVDWEGIPSSLKGKATIDGAKYEWEGQISESSFKATFGGSRYKGYFDLRK